MHSHTIASALADARVADLQRPAIRGTATVPPRRQDRLRALVLFGVVAAVVLFALAPNGAFAQPPTDGAPAAVQNLQSPDTRDAAHATGGQQDLRPPDARDAADGRGTYNAPRVVVVKAPQPSGALTPEPSSAGGIDWADAGIGAGSLLVLSLICLGGALVLVHRRRTHGAPPVARL